MNGILSRGSRLPIKEAESKRKLTRKLFELSPPERVEKGRSDSSTKLRFRDEAKPKRSTWRGGPSILSWKETSYGITGRLQEAKLRRLDKSLIECRLLSEDFPLHLIREGGR